MRNRGGPDAALGAHKRKRLTELSGGGFAVNSRNGDNQGNGIDGRKQIVADAASRQFAIEMHIVHMSDHHDLGASVTHLGQTVDFGKEHIGRRAALDHDQLGCLLILSKSDRSGNTAFLNGDVGARHQPIGGGAPITAATSGTVAKGLDADIRDPRRLSPLRIVERACRFKLLCDRLPRNSLSGSRGSASDGRYKAVHLRSPIPMSPLPSCIMDDRAFSPNVDIFSFPGAENPDVDAVLLGYVGFSSRSAIERSARESVPAA